MRALIFLLVLLGFDWYAFQAVKAATEQWTAWPKTILYTLYWAVPIVTFGFLTVGLQTEATAGNKNTFAIIRAILFILYFSKFLIVLVLVVDDIRRLLTVGYEAVAGYKGYDMGRSKFLSQLAIILGAIPLVTLTYGVLRNRHRYRLFKETVEIENLPEQLEGLKIVQISDIHSGSFTMKEPVRAAIDLINQQQADLVFFTGDLVNSIASEMDNFIDVFDKITSKFGVYSVLGNHDYGDYVRWGSPEAKKANFQKLIDTHKRLGWDLLLNENRVLDIKNEKVAVIGVENYSAHLRFPKYGDLAKSLSRS